MKTLQNNPKDSTQKQIKRGETGMKTDVLQQCKLPEVLAEISRSMNNFITDDLDPTFNIRARLKLELADASQVKCSVSISQSDHDKHSGSEEGGEGSK